MPNAARAKDVLRDIAPPLQAKPKQKAKAEQPWPRYVTTGPLSKNGLTVHVIRSAEEALKAGFDWILKV